MGFKRPSQVCSHRRVAIAFPRRPGPRAVRPQNPLTGRFRRRIAIETCLCCSDSTGVPGCAVRLPGFAPVGGPHLPRGGCDPAMGFASCRVAGTLAAHRRGFDAATIDGPCTRLPGPIRSWVFGALPARMRQVFARPASTCTERKSLRRRRPFSVLRGHRLADPPVLKTARIGSLSEVPHVPRERVRRGEVHG
jgi:hypothetical protein